jgi:hypothetical protein
MSMAYLKVLDLLFQREIFVYVSLVTLDSGNLFQYLSLFSQGDAVNGSFPLKRTAATTESHL